MKPGLLTNAMGSSTRCTLTFAIVLLFALPASFAADTNQQLADRFQQLEQQFRQAETPSQFAAVASAYDELKEPGKPSVSVLFNQANAWCRAEEFGRAIAGYRQAQRIDRRDNSIRSNLDLALEKAGQKPATATAIDYAFFWNDRLTMTELATLISIGVVLASAIFLLNRSSSFNRIALRILCVVTLVLMASFAVKVNREELTKHGVIVVDLTEARKGPASSYEPAYSNAIVDGREFTVESEQQDWVQISIEGSGSGWVPASDVVLY